MEYVYGVVSFIVFYNCIIYASTSKINGTITFKDTLFILGILFAWPWAIGLCAVIGLMYFLAYIFKIDLA